MTPIETTFVTS